MATERFNIESDSDGTWSVFNVMIGLPYEVVDLQLESMPFWLALSI